MVTRLYEWDKNETGWTWIEVTDNKVINLILRDENNLIQVNEDNEVYTDLQLESWISTSDTLPVWITTGRVLLADGRPATWTLTCSKTTSWDYTMYLYGDNGKVYIDNGTGTRKILQEELTAWTWISISSNTISNTWVLSVNWQTWNVTVNGIGETLYVYWDPNNNRWKLGGNREVSEIVHNTVLRFVWPAADHEIGDIYDNYGDSLTIYSGSANYSWVLTQEDCVWIVKDIEWDLTFYAWYGWWVNSN